MADRQKIEKLLNMLASDIDGEMMNAARILRKLAKEEKETVYGVVTKALGTQPTYTPPPPRPRRRDFEVEGMLEKLQYCYERCEYLLTEWEKHFAHSLVEREPYTLSDKQKEIIIRICRKCGYAY